MLATSSLEKTIDKILDQTEARVTGALEDALNASHQRLDDALADLEAEYDKVVSDGKKEADKAEKQIVGGADLEARNKQLVEVEDAVDRVFKEALGRISKVARDESYSKLIASLLKEATGMLGSTDVVVYTSAADRESVQSVLGEFAGAELAAEDIDCLGGIRITSKDGAVTFDNTLDAKISRLKPLIRREIAAKFGVVN